jgi:hypothetical protein
MKQCIRLYYSVNNGKNGAFRQYSGFNSTTPFLNMCWLPNDHYISRNDTSSSEYSLEYARYFWSDGMQTAQVIIQQNYTRSLVDEYVTISREAYLQMFLLGSMFQVFSQAVAKYTSLGGGDSPSTSTANYSVYAMKESFPSFDGELVVCSQTYQTQPYSNTWPSIGGGQSPASPCSPTTFRTSGTYVGTAYSVDIDVAGVLDDLGAEVLPLPLGALRPIDLMVRQ